ncbi:hypothetical protein KSF_080710 [Reticulibacter mediterranei]|uniref:NACHT domain-containing protein n=1 Tax=Reticulibacter mediterranei TaxID=2778369 RepID=A0A8J3ISZ0_9CHLR|nr:NACHT domain-containing protein [Reticulibacter mediterranei]GHO98023.1 hypothetical protein KSF_080710 [Reticulibacter mediterranei]
MNEKPRVSQEAHGSYIAQATGGATATINVYAAPPSKEDQNRRRFLERLHTRYRDLLSGSLHGAVRMTLELEGDPDAVLPPVQLFYETDRQPLHLLPPHTPLRHLYDDAGHELLLLGAAGSGKSTLLLELALDLVGTAEQDQSQLLPVIIPLSSWARKRQPLQQWLGEQVALLYDIALPLSRHWVQQEHLLPLLDGLDEMEEESRTACIAAINAYHHEHLHPLVVASRKAEYEAAVANTPLALHSAVVVQPLSTEQVDAYLIECGESVATLRTALRANPVLQEVVTTPLMLSILILSFQGKTVDDLPIMDSLSEQQRQIFATYVQRMVQRKGTLAHSSPLDLACWLRWLARQMHKHDQTIFYLEHLQPDWLPLRQYRRYVWLAVRLPGILLGICAGAAVFLLAKPTVLPVPEAIEYAIIGGLLGGLLSTVDTETGVSLPQTQISPRQNSRRRFGRCLAIGIITGLLSGLSWGAWLSPQYTLSDWLRDGCSYGVTFGLSGFLLSVWLPLSPFKHASPLHEAAWSWKRPINLLQTVHGRRVLLIATLVGAGFGLSYGLDYGLDAGLSSGLGNGLSIGLSYGLGYGLSVGWSFGLIGLLLSLALQEQTAGIRLTEHLQWTGESLVRSLLSLKHGMQALLLACIITVIGLATGLSEILGVGPDNKLVFDLSNGLSLGLTNGLPTALSTGLIYWILLGLFQGIERSRIEDRSRQLPNQGIYRSLRNSLIMGLISCGIIMIIVIATLVALLPLSTILDTALYGGLNSAWNVALIYWQTYNPGSTALSSMLGYALTDGLSAVWPLGVSGGLLVWAVSGGLATLRHYIIRLLLARSHLFPWDAPRFLEEATARILLRRVGGGYSFPHRLLLDYFVDLPDK